MIGQGGDATDKQLKALAQLLLGLDHKYGGIEAVGHSDVDDRKPDCPGFDVPAWWRTIK